MTDDETQAAPSHDPTEHAYAWSVDDTIPYFDTSQRTTVWLRICAGLAAASVGALIAVLVFVLHDRHDAPSSDRSAPARSAPAVAQTAAIPAAVPTETVTKTVAPPPASPAPVEAVPASDQTTFVICGDGREGVVGGHTTCLFAENVRRAFFASSDGSAVVAYSPVTGERYEMSCSGNYRANFADGSHRVATRCIGGDNDSAEVVIW